MKTTLVLATTTTTLVAGVAFGFYRFSVDGQPPVDTGLTTAVYDLSAGGYSASVQAFAGDGAPLGASVSTSFTVPADAPAPPPPPPATFEAPSGLSVTFG